VRARPYEAGGARNMPGGVHPVFLLRDKRTPSLPPPRWFVWVSSNADPATGTLCPPAQRQQHGPGVCLGAGAAIHFVLNFAGRYPWPYVCHGARHALLLSETRRRGSSGCPRLYMNHCSYIYSLACSPTPTGPQQPRLCAEPAGGQRPVEPADVLAQPRRCLSGHAL
jgi:hypothetical protein